MYEIYGVMKTNLNTTQELINGWWATSMMERKPRPTDTKELEAIQKPTHQKVYGLIKDGALR